MLRVGLTGGIASGKSRVLRRLEAGGCLTLDLDRVAHEVMAPGATAYDDVVAAFGKAVVGPGGAIDRKALAAVVFKDAQARERLNAIVHPRVREEEQRRSASAASAPDAIVVVDAALLVETGTHLRFDRLAVVVCPPDVQLARLMARDALAAEDAAARIRAQLPVTEKRRFAHFEIDSSGTPEGTDAGADALLLSLRELARRPARPLLPEPAALAALLGPLGLRVLDDVARDGALELPRVARALGRTGGAWLALEPAPPGFEPAALMGAAAAWSLARRGLDDELLGLASYSLARAVTADAAWAAEACATAWRMARPAPEGAIAFARRWSGREPQTGSTTLPARPPDAVTLAAAERFLKAARGWPAP